MTASIAYVGWVKCLWTLWIKEINNEWIENLQKEKDHTLVGVGHLILTVGTVRVIVVTRNIKGKAIQAQYLKTEGKGIHGQNQTKGGEEWKIQGVEIDVEEVVSLEDLPKDVRVRINPEKRTEIIRRLAGKSILRSLIEKTQIKRDLDHGEIKTKIEKIRRKVKDLPQVLQIR